MNSRNSWEKPVPPHVARMATMVRENRMDRREFLAFASIMGLSAAGAYGLIGLSAPLPAQAGAPTGWLVAGTLSTVIVSCAATHAGLAPIVIVPDATGSPLANPMCLKLSAGQRRDLPRR
mgnify:CR=1 FL=1